MSVPRSATLGGVVAAIGPLSYLLAAGLYEGDGVAFTAELPQLLAIAAAAAIAAGGLLHSRRVAAGRWLVLAGAVGWCCLAAPSLALRPAAALLAILAAGGMLAALFTPEWSARRRGPRGDEGALRAPAGRLRAASAGLLGSWAFAVAVPVAAPPHAFAALAAGVLLVLALHVAWLVRAFPLRPRAARISLTAALVALGIAGLASLVASDLAAALAAGVPAAALATVRAPRSTAAAGEPWHAPVIESPAAFLVVTFLLLSIGGGFVLASPWCSARASPLGMLDAMFTATSAACVTGLIVADTPVDFSFAGQAAILALIQLGGLGIMSFSTAAFLTLGKRMSLRHESAMASLLSGDHRGDLNRSLRRLLVVTAASEAGGALVLTILFLASGDAPGTAIWRGVFTAVSAFCNAGFALQSDSLLAYQSAPLVLHTCAALIILGGLSPAVIAVLPGLLRGRRPPVQARLALLVTAALLVGGTIVFAAFEWSHSLAGLSLWDKAHNAWLQSATLRTAGFNSVDLASTCPATRTAMNIWMFIGGCPGGTAGGIKTTTVVVLLLSIRGVLAGHGEAIVFGRRISERSVYRSAAVATISLFIVIVGVIAILLTQDVAYDAAIFEVVSAFGTVGLSLGATARLDEVGKVVIMVLMFVGRVGPLTLFLLLGERRAAGAPRYPVEEIETA